MKETSLILLSGGLDSLACFYWGLEHAVLKLALTFDYGQKAAMREKEVASSLCEKYSVEHRVIDLGWLASVSESSLNKRDTDLPHLEENELDDEIKTQASMKSVWVPNRNGVFLNVAASIAEGLHIRQILIGFNKEEAATFPDNSMDYMKAMNDAFEYSTLEKQKIMAPVGELTKKDIFKQVIQKDPQLNYIWSCYLGEDQMCGVCESCMRLKRAIKENQYERLLEKFKD